MCLAKTYVESSDQDGSKLVMENTTRVRIEGETIRVTSLLGETKELQGRIESIDFVDGVLLLHPLS